jgi:hypothetical protein
MGFLRALVDNLGLSHRQDMAGCQILSIRLDRKVSRVRIPPPPSVYINEAQLPLNHSVHLEPGSAGRVLAARMSRRILNEHRFQLVAKKQCFIVQSFYGLKKEGDPDWAMVWGSELPILND